MWKKYCRAGQATGDNRAHALWMLDNWGYGHTIRIFNIYCFSTATIVARTRFSVTLYLHCVSCLFLSLSGFCSWVELHKFPYLHLTRVKVYKRRQLAVRQQFFRIRVSTLTHPLRLIVSKIPFLPITVTSKPLNGLSCVGCRPVIIYP